MRIPGIDVLENGSVRLANDPADETLNRVVANGQLEVIEPDILCLYDGTIEFRRGDDYVIVPTDRGYTRQWPSVHALVAYARQEKKERGQS